MNILMWGITVAFVACFFSWVAVRVSVAVLRRLGFSEWEISILSFRNETISAALLCKRFKWEPWEVMNYIKTGEIPERFKKVLDSTNDR